MRRRRSQSARSAPSAGGTPQACSAHAGGLAASCRRGRPGGRPSSAPPAAISGDSCPGCALSPSGRRAPRRGRFFSRPPCSPAAMLRSPVSGSAVIESSTSSIRRPPISCSRSACRNAGRSGSVRYRSYSAARDPLADHLVDLRHDVELPERLGQLQQVPGVGGEVLRGLDLLERGPLRLVLLQRLGQDRLPRCQLPVAGPVRHPQRHLPRQVGSPASRSAARLRIAPRCRRPARPGSAGPGPAPRSPRGWCSSPGPGSRRCRPGCGSRRCRPPGGPVDGAALGDVDVARVGRARRRSPGRPPGRRTAGTTGQARSAARLRPAARTRCR